MVVQQQITPLDLEDHLRILCEQENLDLHDRLERIKKSVERIWNLPKLYWFTDHGVGHSKRIIQVLGSLLTNLQTSGESALTSHELYILLAACYLHDIGMQFCRIENKSIENYTYGDFEWIRRSHPATAEQLIVSRAIRHERGEFSIDLDPDPSYFIPIALVCKAHGSKFFDETVEKLKQDTPYQPGGLPFRGAMLAGLLMLADELDLQLNRATFPEDVTLSPMSTLHHRVHSYVTGVVIMKGSTEKTRFVQIDMVFPSNSDEYQNLVVRWLKSKLTKQIRRVTKLIQEASNGELLINTRVNFRSKISDYDIEPVPLSRMALNILQKEVADVEMINQEKPREIYSQMLESPPIVRSLVLNSPDELSESKSIDWFKAQCNYKEVACCIINFRDEPYNINDLIQSLLRFVNEFSNNPSDELGTEVDNKEDNPLAAFLDRLAELLQSNQIVFVLRNVDHAERRVSQWVYEVLFNKLNEMDLSAPLVLTCTKSSQTLSYFHDFQEQVSWDEISQESIEEVYLKYGFDGADARLNAERVSQTSGGLPKNIIMGLQFERDFVWS